jgi:DNA-directed RNA polymerase subunit beta'
MLSAHNILSPAHGRPIAVPNQDQIIGAYYLTEVVPGACGEGRAFASLDEAVRAYEQRFDGGAWRDPDHDAGIDLHARIRVRMPAGRFPAHSFTSRFVWDEAAEAWTSSPETEAAEKAGEQLPIVLRRSGANGDGRVLVETSLGRLLLNEAFPPDMPFQTGGRGDEGMKKRELTEVVTQLVKMYGRAEVAESLDKLKDLGFDFSTRAGLTISMTDVRTPAEKAAILDKHEQEAEKVEAQYDRGIITDDERRQKEIEIWTEATDEVRRAMESTLSAERFNPIDMMVGSGARGNVMQVRRAVSARPLRAPCVEMKYSSTDRPSRKLLLMGRGMISPRGLATRPRIPAI